MPRASAKEEAAKLAEEGKAVVWIDGGLHASEALCAQVLMETLYQYLVANDAETLRILDDVIILFVHANPDGMDLVADYYMKSAKDPKDRTVRTAAAGFTRNTSATTTTAISTPTPSPKPRT